jgi:hypothetical protein
VVALLLGGLVVTLYTGSDERGPSARLMLDAPYYQAYAVSLVRDRDLHFHNEYGLTGNYQNLQLVKATNRWGNVFGIGPPLYSLPFYLAGELAEKIKGEDSKGFRVGILVKLTLLASPVYTALSLIFIYRLLRRRIGGLAAPLGAGVIAILSGPAFYYAVRQPGNSHPAAMFFAAWLIDAWDASYDRPRTWRTWLVLGALFGATVLARPQLALWGVLLVAAALDDLKRVSWREQLPRWLAAGGLALLVFTPQLLVWNTLYGKPWIVPQGDTFMVWSAPRWSEVLFSTRNGLFAWSPLYAVAILGLVVSLRRSPRLSALLLCGFVGQVIANGAVWDWWAGPS